MKQKEAARNATTYNKHREQETRQNVIPEEQHRCEVCANADVGILVVHSFVFQDESDHDVLLHQKDRVFQVRKERIFVTIVVHHHRRVADELQVQRGRTNSWQKKKKKNRLSMTRNESLASAVTSRRFISINIFDLWQFLHQTQNDCYQAQYVGDDQQEALLNIVPHHI